MRKVILFILLSFIVINVSAKKIAEFDDIYKPRQIEISGDDLYVFDGETIKLFSIRNMELVKIIGNKGEGPGEFVGWTSIRIFDDGIFVKSRRKILFFTQKGEFISEKKLPVFTSFFRIKQNYLSRELKSDFKTTEVTINVKVLDKDFNLLKELYTMVDKSSSGFSGKSKIDMEVSPKMKIAVTDGEYIYVINTFKGFYFEIFDHTGKQLNTIYKDIYKIKFSEEEKRKYIKRLKKTGSWERINSRYNLIFPKYYPEIRDVTGENNKIFVSTYKEINEKFEIITLDINGKTLKTSYVPKSYPSDIHNDKFYYLKDNEEEEVWELHVVDL